MNTDLIKFFLLFVALFLAVAINVPDGLFSPVGIESNYLVALIVATSFTGLLAHRASALIVAIGLLSIAAAMPAATLESWGISRVALLAALMAVILTPVVARFFD